MFNLNKLKKKNICIMGLMGSGKSIIGRDLAKYLDLKFYDTDKEIELRTKKSINSIFRDEGELYFRNLEEEICLKLLKCDNCLISLGGGSIINNNIRQAIKKYSYSIYLKVAIYNLLNRLQSSKKRPLLSDNKKKREVLENLYKERRMFYEEADFIVHNNKDKIKVLEKIKTELNLYDQ